MPKLVKAIADGFYGGSRRRAGSEFSITDSTKVGKWMQVVKDVPANTGAASGDKDALIELAKSLGIPGVAKTWGIAKLEAEIAEAKAQKATAEGEQTESEAA